MGRLKEKTDISKDTRKIVLLRDSYYDVPVCQSCGSPYNLELAHFVPRSRGGMGIPENLVTLCHKCHQASHNADDNIRNIMLRRLEQCYEDWCESKVISKKSYNIF